ncbi:MAG: response regulator transcription factor [Archangium sp.]
MSTAPTLLLVDDDETFRTRLGRAMSQRGFVVTLAASTEEALTLIQDAPEFAVIDLRMPGKSGLELLAALKAQDPNTHVVMLTGYGSISTAVDATKRGAAVYLTKPVDADEVHRALLGETKVEAPDDSETPTLARAEWEYINRVLHDCDDNVSEAARRLGIHRRSLQRKLQKYPPPR